MKITWIQPYYDLLLDHIPLDTETLIDVGSGYGIFGYIISKARNVKKLISIDPFNYIVPHYTDHYCRTWQEFYLSISFDFKVDVIVSTEMIEHMDKGEAMMFLDQVKKVADKVIIATPYKFEEQEPYDGNEFQLHKCVITSDDLKELGYSVYYFGTSSFPPKVRASRKLYQTRKVSKIKFGMKPTNLIGVWEK